MQVLGIDFQVGHVNKYETRDSWGRGVRGGQRSAHALLYLQQEINCSRQSRAAKRMDAKGRRSSIEESIPGRAAQVSRCRFHWIEAVAAGKHLLHHQSMR